MKEARTKAGLLSHGRIEGASMSTGDRDELLAAREIAGSTPVLAALREWTKAREISQGSLIAACEFWASRNVTKRERVKVEEVVRRFLESKRKAKIQTEKNHGHIFVELKAKFGAEFIDAIGASELNAWLAEKVHMGTRHTYRKHLVGVWRWAQSENILPREVKTEAEHTQTVKLPDHKRGTITPQTLRALLALIRSQHPEYLPALVLSTLCGLRRSEVHEQTWENIDLVGRTLTVSKAKPGTPSERPVPVPRAAVAWLMLSGNRKGNVCDNLAVDRIRDIARTAGFELPENAFRHSFITYRCKIVTVSQVADEAGNSPTILRKHYRNIIKDERPMRKAEAKAWFESAPDMEAKILQLPRQAKSA